MPSSLSQLVSQGGDASAPLFLPDGTRGIQPVPLQPGKGGESGFLAPVKRPKAGEATQGSSPNLGHFHAAGSRTANCSDRAASNNWGSEQTNVNASAAIAQSTRHPANWTAS